MSEAEKVRQEAEKKCKKTFLNAFTGGPNYYEACDLFKAAANQYKVANDWTRAAECFLRAAEMNAIQSDISGEAGCYVEAGNMYRKISSSMAAEHFNLACKLYVKAGRFSQAGKLMKTIADEYEQDADLKSSEAYYKQAASYFELDEYSKSMYSQCIVKYAEITAKVSKHYDEAIKIFENEGTKALKNTLIQFGAKEHFFKAGILQMVKGDAITASVNCEKYENTDPRFASSREGILLKTLCRAFEDEDVDSFIDAIAEYDRLSRLDPWKVHFLNKIKELFPSETSSKRKTHEAPPEEALLDAAVDSNVDQSGEFDLT